MKKILLLFVLCNSGLKAQITFTEADLQEGGRTYITATDTLTAVPLGTPSALSQNWDFSNLLMHYVSGPTFDSTSFTPFAADFPNSNLYTYGPAIMFGGFFGGAPVSEQGMNNGYMFWRKDVTGFWTEGFRADEGEYEDRNVYMTPPEMILGTPTTYGIVYNNSSSWQLDFDVNPTDVDTVYNSWTVKTQEADAWGTMETPTDVYSDVLRIHEYVIKFDSIKSYVGGNLVFRWN